MREGVGETRGVVAVRHLVALEVFLRSDGGDAEIWGGGYGGERLGDRRAGRARLKPRKTDE